MTQTIIYWAVLLSGIEFFVAGAACLFVKGMGLWAVLYLGLGVVNSTLAVITKGAV